MENLLKPKPKKTEMTETEIESIIESWLIDRECNYEENDKKYYTRKLFYAVKNERLKYESGVFTYKLFDPIETKNSGNIEILKVHKATLRDKREMEKAKSDFDALIKMYCAYCTPDHSSINDLSEGNAMDIQDDDADVIQGLILGFFVKAARPEMSQVKK